MKVKLTVYRNYLIIDTVSLDEAHPDFVPNGDGRIGCVLMNTEVNLGASDEAMAWLRRLVRCRDAIGDVMAFKSDKGMCFGWLGGPLRIISPDAEAARDTLRNFSHIVIPNDVPEEAKAVIDARNNAMENS